MPRSARGFRSAVRAASISCLVWLLGPCAFAVQLGMVPSCKQGQTVEVKVTGAGPEAPPIRFNGRAYKTFSGADGTLQALIGVPADLPPGTYPVSCGDEVVSKLKVVPGGFGVQSIRLPKGKDNFQGSPGEAETVAQAKQTVSDLRMWSGRFQVPCKGRVSAGFGLRRSVNGKLLPDYFHSGVDYAAGAGAPVHATAGGKVVLARRGWKLHGNTICIDHGQGVVSFYIHLSSIAVKEGSEVRAGQKIGAVGATGRASGPHLHFSIYVNGAATNPSDWFARGF